MITAHDHSEASTRTTITPFTTQSDFMKMARAEKSAAPSAPEVVGSMLPFENSVTAGRYRSPAVG